MKSFGKDDVGTGGIMQLSGIPATNIVSILLKSVNQNHNY